MTKFADPKFSVAVGGKAYAEGWERIFGKKPLKGICPWCGEAGHNYVGPPCPGPKCKECSDTGSVMVEDPHHGHALRTPCRCQQEDR